MQKKKIAKQRDPVEDMWEMYEEKVYTKNININLKKFEKTKKIKLIEKNEKTYV